MNNTIILNGSPLTPENVVRIARNEALIDLDSTSKNRMNKSKELVEIKSKEDKSIYGVNTGFGSLAQTRIKTEKLKSLQKNLIRSHACGIGEILPNEIVRGTMCILSASLARGYSGVTPDTVLQINTMLNKNCIPIVPSRGSVGASGDLAPLAHIAQALIGEGYCLFNNKKIDSLKALEMCNLKPLELTPKSGLALLNGTHLMTSLLSIAIIDMKNLIKSAIDATALSIDGCLASFAPFDKRIHGVRKQNGQQVIAKKLFDLLKDSDIAKSHLDNDIRVQDPYSFRAAPQILGSCFDQFQFSKKIIEDELNSVTDNPLVFSNDREILSGANFHGMPLSIVADTLKLILAHIAGVSERRIFWALSGHDKYNKLPPFLTKDPGLQSGLMITQYAAASCVTELRQLASPASVGNISTCAGIEDYNSQGATASLQLRDSIKLATYVISIELMVMSQALEFHRPLKSTKYIENLYENIRKLCPPFTADRSPSKDIELIAQKIKEGL